MKQFENVSKAIKENPNTDPEGGLVKDLSHCIYEAVGENVDFVKVTKIHDTVSEIISPWQISMQRISKQH